MPGAKPFQNIASWNRTSTDPLAVEASENETAAPSMAKTIADKQTMDTVLSEVETSCLEEPFEADLVINWMQAVPAVTQPNASTDTYSSHSFDMLEENNSLEETNCNEDISSKADQTEKSQIIFLDDTDPLTISEQSNFIPKQSLCSSINSLSSCSPSSLIKIASVSALHQTKTPAKGKQDMHESFPESRCQEFLKKAPCQCPDLKLSSTDAVDGFFFSISSTVKNSNLSVSDLALFQCKIMTFAYEELEKLKK